MTDSLHFDQTTKQRLYATANEGTYWLVNLPARTLEVYESPDPSAGRFRQRKVFTADQTVSLRLREVSQEAPVPSLIP